MSKGVNKVILVGNLGNDPEIKYTQGGMCIATISLATTSYRKNKDGEALEKTEWHRVKLFGKLGEVAGEYLKKGRQVYIEGRIEYSTSGEGDQKKYYTDIIADEMQMLGSGGGSNGERGESNPPGRVAAQSGSRSGYANRGANQGERKPVQTRPVDDFADDDIPF